MVWSYNLFFSFSFFFFLVGFEFLCFSFLVEKDKNKVLKSDMMYFRYFEINTDLF